MFQLSEKKEKGSRPVIQTSLKIGRPGDKYEQEADAVAEKVMMMSESETMQMQPVEEEEEVMQPKLRLQPVEQRQLRMQPGSGNEEKIASPEIVQKLNSTSGKGQSLPAGTNQFMGNAFGADFSGVKIHTDSNAVKMNQEFGARAFTHGSDIYFNEGEFKPESNKGKKLLAHELTHVVQQNTESLTSSNQNNNALFADNIQRKENVIQRDGGTTAAVAALAYQISSEVLSSAGGGSDIDLVVDEMTGMFYGRHATAAGRSAQTNPTRRRSHLFSYLLESVLFRSNLIELILRMDYEVDSFGIGNISFAIERIDDAAGWGGRFNVNLTPMDSERTGAVRLTVNFDTSGLGTSASGSFVYMIDPYSVYLIRETGDTGDFLGMQDSHRAAE